MNNKLRGNEFWGEGIPEYEKEDLMSKREILDFSIEIVLQFGTEKEEYNVVSIDNKITSNPNIILEKGGKIYYVLVRGDDVHSQPTITQSEKNLLIENSKKNDAIPLFASVGIGSVDPERFEAKLLLRNDEFYANFVGYEELEVDNTKCKNESNKSKEPSIKKEIGSLYVWYNKEQSGHYNSFRNFCHNKMVYLSFAYGRNGVHIDSTPDKYKISEESSNKIREIVKNEFKNLVLISREKASKLDSHISVVYIDGMTEHYEFNEKIAKAFELREKIKEGFDIVSEPYLIFNDKNYNENVRTIVDLRSSIKNKDIDGVIDCLSLDFQIEFNCSWFNDKITTVRELKQLYRKIAGVFGNKLSSHYIFADELGILENGMPKVNMKVQIRGKRYRKNCVCKFDFDNMNKIKYIHIAEYEDLKSIGKSLSNEDMDEIINGNYNDMNEKEYPDIVDTNKDPNSIFRVQK